MVATEKDMLKALDRYYAAGGESVETLDRRHGERQRAGRPPPQATGEGPIDLTSVEALADSAPVRKLLNMVLLMAIKDHASDLHFEPFEDEFKIRIKADGVLYEMVPPPRHLAFAITTRIKVMANLDIAERRLPQDGRIELDRRRPPGRPARQRAAHDVRRKRRHAGARPLGGHARPGQRRHGRRASSRQFREVIRKPNGIVLVTGPTGSRQDHHALRGASTN